MCHARWACRRHGASLLDLFLAGQAEPPREAFFRGVQLDNPIVSHAVTAPYADEAFELRWQQQLRTANSNTQVANAYSEG